MGLDKDGYPDPDDLLTIVKCDLVGGDVVGGDVDDLIELVRDNWKYGGATRTATRLRLVTSGWSGNEEVVEALQRNFLFWSLHWLLKCRGSGDPIKRRTGGA